MSRQAPYLQRRGDTFSFRIAVPSELRSIVCGREITKSLQTTDKRIAVPLALQFAATAKQLFHKLKTDMSESKNNKLREVLIETRGRMRLLTEREEHENELFEQKRTHLKEIKQVKLQAENDALKHALASSHARGRAYSYFTHAKLSRGAR